LAQGVAPDANASEKMALGETSDVAGANILDRSFIYFSWGNKPRIN